MPSEAPGIFISYRRLESSHFAGRLYDRFAEHFGEARVFMDVDSIRPGEDWTEAVNRAVARCGLMLVLIGPQWAQVSEAGGRRIDNPDDLVRLEIEAALDHAIPVIPVLLEDAVMPGSADLPDSVARLAHLQAIRMRHESFRSDTAWLLKVVDELFAGTEPGESAAGTEPGEARTRRSRRSLGELLRTHPEAVRPGRRIAGSAPLGSGGAAGPDQAGTADRVGASPQRRPRTGEAMHPPGGGPPVGPPGSGQPPAGPPGSGQPPAGPSGSGRRWPWRPSPRLAVPLLVAVVVVASAVVGAVLLTSRNAAPAERLEPADTVVDHPFMRPVVVVVKVASQPSGSAGAVSGDMRGLYGGTSDPKTCDPQGMVTFLRQHPDKAAAWAGTLGIAESEIGAFVAELTPLILRVDTRVTNHGFADGRATTVPAVLQAGTAVLVDKRGMPTVKCACGNPLTEPQSNPEPTFEGPQWPGFAAERVVVIQRSITVITTFTVTDLATGKQVSQPAGTKVVDPSTGPGTTGTPGSSNPAGTVAPSGTPGPSVAPSGTETTAGPPSTGSEGPGPTGNDTGPGAGTNPEGGAPTSGGG
ncbi:MAG TPA: toll/interleukin-1 receptor domain-containing protein [Micromonosporaceae bacterium]